MNTEIKYSNTENYNERESYSLPNSSNKEIDNEESIDSYSESMKHGMCLKDLLSQGFENPFGLEQQFGLNERNLPFTSSPIKSVEDNIILKNKNLESKNDLQNLVSSFRFNNENTECASLNRNMQKDEIDYIDVDLNVNVSQIVDEVLKEEDQSYLFGESPKSTVTIISNHQNAVNRHASELQTRDITYIGNSLDQVNLNTDCYSKKEAQDETDNGILLVLHPQPDWNSLPPSEIETYKSHTYIEETNSISQTYPVGDDDHMSLPNFIELVLSLNENKDRLAESNASKMDSLATDVSNMPPNTATDLCLPPEDGEMTLTLLGKSQPEITNLDKPDSLRYCDIQERDVNENMNQNTIKLNTYIDNFKMPLKKRKLMLDNIESSSIGKADLNAVEDGCRVNSSSTLHNHSNCTEKSSSENRFSSTKNVINLSVPQVCVARWFQCVTLHPNSDIHDEVKMVPATFRSTSQTEEYIDCLECQKQYLGPCSLHCKALVLDRNVIRNGSFKDRARCTLPWPFVLRQSSIPGTDLGVWTEAKISKDLVFGPYEGKMIPAASVMCRSAYSWMISRVGQEPYIIDAEDTAFSNWLRYVNWGSDPSQNNLEAFHYLGQIFYRSTKVIYRNTELIVWYGEEYKKSQESLTEIDGKVAGFSVEGDNENSSLPLNIISEKRGSSEANLRNEKRALTVSNKPEETADKDRMPEKRRRGRPPKLQSKTYVDGSAQVLSNSKRNLTNNENCKEKENINVNKINTLKSVINSNTTESLKTLKEGRKGRGRGKIRGKKFPGTSFVRNLNVWNSINRVVKAMTECSKEDNSLTYSDKDSVMKSDTNQLVEIRDSDEKPNGVAKHNSVNSSRSPLSPTVTHNNAEVYDTVTQSIIQEQERPKVSKEDSSFEKLFFCATCFSSFDNILLFLKDDLSHFREFPLQCGCCQERFKTFKELKQHLNTEDQHNLKTSEEYFMDLDLLFKCKECKNLLRHTKNLTVIFKTHLIDCHKSVCNEILKEFNNFIAEQSLTQVIVDTFDITEDVSSCPFCFEKSIDVGKLNQHILDHTAAASFQKCKDCHIWFPSESLVKQHSKCHESKEHLIENSQGTVEIVNSIPNFPSCLVPRLQFMLSDDSKDKGYCKKSTNNEDNSKKKSDISPPDLRGTESNLTSNLAEEQPPILHKKKRGRKKSLSCKVCCKTFPDCSSLQDHKKTHKTKKNCHICNKSYVTNVGLKQHMIKLHCNTNVVCKTCDKTFTDMALLKQHKKIHRKTFTFDCTSCKKSFRTKLSYIYHISTHGGFSLTYNCDSCGKVFHSYSSYTTHTLKECPTKTKEEENLRDEEQSEQEHQNPLPEVSEEPDMMPLIM